MCWLRGWCQLKRRRRRNLVTGVIVLLMLEVEELANIVLGISGLKVAQRSFLEVLQRR